MMYKLKLGKGCISCGICMDICPPQAIDMRIHFGHTIEGRGLTYLDLNGFSNSDRAPMPMMTFPFMAHPDLCDGCTICVRECLTNAMIIISSDGNNEQFEEEAYERRPE